jgi:hypothetical protein
LRLTTKSQIEKRQARTAADSEQKAEDLFVCQHSSKPHVEPNPARWGGETSVTFVFSKSKTKTMQKKQQHCSVLH